jgi:Sec-independent protein translocase protein TatA
MALGSMELVLIVLIVGLLFGSTLLPKLASAIVQSRREFSRGREAPPRKHAD